MQPFEEIKKYGKAVCNQIRWKRAHSIISEEIESHLVDQRNAYISGGDDEATATKKAIAQMGDPVILGTQLDRTHRPEPQWSMFLITALLLCIGLFIRVFLINDGDRPWLMPMQIISVVIGAGMMFAAYFADFSILGKYPKTVYFSILALSVIVLAVSPEFNGRAFYAQYTPLLFPIALSSIIYWARNKGYQGIILCGIAFIAPAFIALLVPALSGFLLFTVSGLVLICMAIHKNWFGIKKLYGYLAVFIPIIVSLLLGLLNISGNSHRWHRLQIVLNPSLDPNGAGYMGTVTKALLENAKLFGRGTMPEQYAMSTFPMPNIDTDYLLTYLIFNVGWISFFFIAAVLAVFTVKGFLLCFKQKSVLGLLASTAVMLTFALQVFGYIITNLGFQLFVPISLPLISYGNVSSIINLALIGLMLSVFRNGAIVKDKSGKAYSNKKFISWNNGVLTIDFNK